MQPLGDGTGSLLAGPRGPRESQAFKPHCPKGRGSPVPPPPKARGPEGGVAPALAGPGVGMGGAAEGPGGPMATALCAWEPGRAGSRGHRDRVAQPPGQGVRAGAQSAEAQAAVPADASEPGRSGASGGQGAVGTWEPALYQSTPQWHPVSAPGHLMEPEQPRGLRSAGGHGSCGWGPGSGRRVKRHVGSDPRAG